MVARTVRPDFEVVYRFTVPGTPVAWQRPGQNKKTGRTFTPKETRRYEDTVRVCAMQACKKPMVGAVRLVVDAFWPSKKPDLKRNPRPSEWKPTTPDADNVLKAICDGLNSVAFLDDAQVVEATIRKFHAAQGTPARVEVCVEAEYPIEIEVVK